MDRSTTLLTLARTHFTEEILPQLQTLLGEKLKDLIVYVTGSVSTGLADDFSDIDIEMYTSGAITQEDKTEISSIAFKNFEINGIRLSYWPDLRKKEFDKIIQDIDEFWKEVNPDMVYDLSHVIPLYDQHKLISTIKAKIQHYPNDLYKRVVRGLWLTINDRGLYKAAQLIERKDLVTAEIYLSDALEALLKLCFLLNNQYFPNTKWLVKGLTKLNNNFSLVTRLSTYVNLTSLQKLTVIKEVTNSIKDHMLKEKTIEPESLENAWSILKMKLPYTIFNTF